MIVKKEDGWYVESESGRNLGGPYKSRGKAEKRLAQVEYFKHKKEAGDVSSSATGGSIVGGTAATVAAMRNRGIKAKIDLDTATGAMFSDDLDATMKRIMGIMSEDPKAMKDAERAALKARAKSILKNVGPKTLAGLAAGGLAGAGLGIVLKKSRKKEASSGDMLNVARALIKSGSCGLPHSKKKKKKLNDKA